VKDLIAIRADDGPLVIEDIAWTQRDQHEPFTVRWHGALYAPSGNLVASTLSCEVAEVFLPVQP
jgi:hypothetical protein